jgi:Raf kinase inhibitor-like YbhB/YbcL family protein
MMKLWSNAFKDGEAIPGDNAFAIPDAKSHLRLSANRNPHLAWSDVPEGTKSFALICVDPDVPSHGDDVNIEGKVIPADLPRVDFYHWILLDLPADTRSVDEGVFSDGVQARGKPGPEIKAGPFAGCRHGINDYTQFFAGDGDMAGDYFGYDGPCPPWNDARLHHYVFTLYALDVAQLSVQGNLNGAEVLSLLQGHILAQASLTGTYTLNPDLVK